MMCGLCWMNSNPHGKLSNNFNLRFIKEKSGNIYMEKTLKVELFLNFIEAFILCVLLGYLLHDLTSHQKSQIVSFLSQSHKLKSSLYSIQL